MNEAVLSPFPFVTLQYHLLGGHKRMGMVTFAYVVIVILACWGWSRSVSDFSAVGGNILNIIACTQVGFLFLGGANAIYRATLRDFQTRMIESHRLTPMSKLSVVIGYMIGAPLQVELLFVLNLISGSIISLLSSLPVSEWIIGNLCLLNASLTVYAFAAFAGVGTNKPISAAPVVVAVGMLSAFAFLIPPIGVLSGFYSTGIAVSMLIARGAVFSLPAGAGSYHSIAVILAPLQLFATAFMIWASARRYRRPDLPVFNALGGVVLLLAWFVLTILAIEVFQADSALRARFPRDDSPLIVSWIGSLLGGLLIAALAVMGTVETLSAIVRGRFPRDKSDRISARSTLIANIVIFGASSLWFVFRQWRDSFGDWDYMYQIADEGLSGTPYQLALITVGVVLLTLLTVLGIMRWAFARPVPAKRLAIVCVIALWLTPLMVDLARIIYFISMDLPVSLTFVWNCSPLGAMVSVWYPQLETKLVPGLVFQAIAAGIFMWIGHTTWQKAIPAAATPPIT